MMETRDEGSTWSNVVDITAMVALPIWFHVAPGMPGGVQLPSGRLIVGTLNIKGSPCHNYRVHQ